MRIHFYFSTFVCPTEIIAFSDRVEEFRKINAEVVAVSVDSVFTHLAWYDFIPSLYLFFNYIIPYKILKPNNTSFSCISISNHIFFEGDFSQTHLKNTFDY